METIKPIALSENDVLALAVRRASNDFATVVCVALAHAQIALQIGETLELFNEVAVTPLPRNNFGLPIPKGTNFLPWNEAKPLIKLLAENQ